MFSKILIANRGEIACRIIRTCRKLGVLTVAVYSEADEQALHRKSADEAVLIGPAEARKSYLNIERIIQAALQTGAQAIHPGYGFLSENAEFAKACANAGIVFIGPPVEAIEAMGSKAAAKRLMVAAGVPVVPGYQGEAQDHALLLSEAQRIGFPLLIKASAGGGGKGMRLVTQLAEFEAALVSAQREALSSFGDEHVIIERFVESPRHIEVQVFGDSHGHIIHLFERECTLQRRHQKVVEEAPSPTITEETRQQMGASAVAAARAVNYQGAGTIEFIVGKDGSYYFMEMNTRLQVEHPVTEMITGQDLVEWQLRVASGESLPLRQEQLEINGHAIEVRLYAEDPQKGFLPTTGSVRHFVRPQLGHNVRLDAGIQAGDEVKLHYDPMLAKLITWGKTREVARQTLVTALEQMCLFGLTTNQQFLHRLLQHPSYLDNQVDTGFIERALPTLTELPQSVPLAVLSTVAALRHHEETQNLISGHFEQLGHHSVWSDFSGWSLNHRPQRPLFVCINGQEHRLSASMTADGRVTFRDGSSALVRQNDENTWAVTLPNSTETVSVVAQLDGYQLFHSGLYYTAEWEFNYEHQTGQQAGSGKHIVAPMPGKVVKIFVEAGQVVTKGSPILILEAMKMENTISSFKDARIAEVFCKFGDQVQEGEVLVALDAATESNASAIG